jgi:hypothetical protein
LQPSPHEQPLTFSAVVAASDSGTGVAVAVVDSTAAGAFSSVSICGVSSQPARNNAVIASDKEMICIFDFMIVFLFINGTTARDGVPVYSFKLCTLCAIFNLTTNRGYARDFQQGLRRTCTGSRWFLCAAVQFMRTPGKKVE